MNIPVEGRAAIFVELFSKIVRKYSVCVMKYSPGDASAHRVAYLAMTVLVRIYSADIGQDAQCYFYYWAKGAKVSCAEIPELERRRGKKLYRPFPTGYGRIYGHLSFHKYTELLEQLLSPERVPVVRREPIAFLSRVIPTV